MATETVEITLPGLTGFTFTAKLYADGSDTLVDTIATLTEATNRKCTYTGTTATGATGLHLIVVLEGTTVRGEGYVQLRDSASGVTVAGSREGARLDVATIPSATLASTTNITGGIITTVTNLTNAPTSGDLTVAMKSSVNAEVLDVLNTDTFAEPGQGAPGATISLAAKIGFLYKAWRNKITQTSTTYTLYADDATTADQAATVSDDATTFTKGEVGTGA